MMSPECELWVESEGFPGPGQLTPERNILFRDGGRACWYLLPNGVILSCTWTHYAWRHEGDKKRFSPEWMQWFQEQSKAHMDQWYQNEATDKTERPQYASIEHFLHIIATRAKNSVEVWTLPHFPDINDGDPIGFMTAEDVEALIYAVTHDAPYPPTDTDDDSVEAE